MTEPEPTDSRPQQGADARAAVEGTQTSQEVPEGERMARGLVRDIAAYEVDPPPPARADPAP